MSAPTSLIILCVKTGLTTQTPFPREGFLGFAGHSGLFGRCSGTAREKLLVLFFIFFFFSLISSFFFSSSSFLLSNQWMCPPPVASAAAALRYAMLSLEPSELDSRLSDSGEPPPPLLTVDNWERSSASERVSSGLKLSTSVKRERTRPSAVASFRGGVVMRLASPPG